MSENRYLDQHFSNLGRLKNEKDPAMIEQICLEDIAIAEQCRQEWQNEAKEFAERCRSFHEIINAVREPAYYQSVIDNYAIPRYVSFEKLAILYTRQKRYQEAISICERAISLGFEKGVSSGMHTRLEKLKQKVK